jgi:hypothetical protein
LLILACLIAPVGTRAATVSGFVRSAADGEALIYANVYLENTRYGCMSNAQGYYVIPDLPAGEYRIVFSYMGFATETRDLSLTADEELNLTVELEVRPIELGAVEVEARRSEGLPQPSAHSLDNYQLVTVPAAIEADLFRAVQSLPGVSTLSDFSSGLYVRGGSADQNLILLDDVDVYNPSHLFGFFSTFNVDAVKRVDLQKSAYPARYGGRLSALLDVHNRDGNRKRLAGVARVSLIDANLTLDGPWPRGSWMVAARRTYLDFLGKLMDTEIPYRFYDVHGRLNLDIDTDDRLSVSFFRGRDLLDWDQNASELLLEWGNDTFSTQWTHPVGSQLFSQFLVGGSRFISEASATFQDFRLRVANEIEDVSVKGNLSYAPSAGAVLDFGFEAKDLAFSWHQELGKDEQLTFAYDGTYGALYSQYGFGFLSSWQALAGIRLNYYSRGDYLDLDPRVTLSHSFHDFLSAHLSYGRYHQYLNLVSEGGVGVGDQWFPVDETLKPGKADHWVLGVDLGPYDHFSLSLEGYYKSYGNVVEFSDEFGRSLMEEDAKLGEAFDSGEGHAYGLDTYLRNRIWGFEGWLGYSYGDTRRQIESFNYGREYHPVYDRRHQVVVMQEYRLGAHWRLNMNFRYGSGQPTTLGTGRYRVRDITGREYDAVLPGELNAYRLPPYHRLDVGITFDAEYWGLDVSPTLQIINLYNHDNVWFRYYDTTKNPVKIEDVNMIPLMATVGVKVAF